LKQGARAEICLVDPERKTTIDAVRLRSKSKNTPFLGRSVTGAVAMTLANGRVVFDADARLRAREAAR
jgi:dihydroorotase